MSGPSHSSNPQHDSFHLQETIRADRKLLAIFEGTDLDETERKSGLQRALSPFMHYALEEAWVTDVVLSLAAVAAEKDDPLHEWASMVKNNVLAGIEAGNAIFACYCIGLSDLAADAKACAAARDLWDEAVPAARRLEAAQVLDEPKLLPFHATVVAREHNPALREKLAELLVSRLLSGDAAAARLCSFTLNEVLNPNSPLPVEELWREGSLGEKTAFLLDIHKADTPSGARQPLEKKVGVLKTQEYRQFAAAYSSPEARKNADLRIEIVAGVEREDKTCLLPVLKAVLQEEKEERVRRRLESAIANLSRNATEEERDDCLVGDVSRFYVATLTGSSYAIDAALAHGPQFTEYFLNLLERRSLEQEQILSGIDVLEELVDNDLKAGGVSSALQEALCTSTLYIIVQKQPDGSVNEVRPSNLEGVIIGETPGLGETLAAYTSKDKAEGCLKRCGRSDLVVQGIRGAAFFHCCLLESFSAAVNPIIKAPHLQLTTSWIEHILRNSGCLYSSLSLSSGSSLHFFKPEKIRVPDALKGDLIGLANETGLNLWLGACLVDGVRGTPRYLLGIEDAADPQTLCVEMDDMCAGWKQEGVGIDYIISGVTKNSTDVVEYLKSRAVPLREERLYEPEVVETDQSETYLGKLMARATVEGDIAAMIEYGKWLLEGRRPLFQNPQAADNCFVHAAEAGSLSGLALHGAVLLMYGGSNTIRGEGYDLLVKCMQKDEPEAIRVMADLMYRGFGVHQDIQGALSNYQRAVALGSGEACFRLGMRYVEGTVVPQDYTEACRLFRKGAEAGNSQCMSAIANFTLKGLGVTRDLDEARKWARASADMMNTSGMQSLCAVLETQGNLEEAEAILEQACRLGDEDAMCAMATRCLHGTFGRIDRPKGIYWLRMGAERGHEECGMALQQMGG